jgi:DivIVA domain-containing protein
MAEPDPLGSGGFTIKRVFAAAPERVWREWTEPESFADWFRDEDCEVAPFTVSMDVRAGGARRATMSCGPERRVIRWSGEYRGGRPAAVSGRRKESAAYRRTQRTMAATGEGETRSVYVVQRHFRRVRRGYDPAEVDRHLQVVSEWFRQSRAAEQARDLEKTLQARERAMAERENQTQRLVESTRLEAEATLQGARLQARADTEAASLALRESERAAAERLKEADAARALAREEAERLRAAVREERAAILNQARLDAAAAEIILEAEKHAEQIVGQAETRAQRVAAEAEQRREQELLTAHTAAEHLLAAMRAEAAEEVRDLRAQAERDLQSFVERRHREVDRLVDAARRERRRSDDDAED